MRLRAVFALAAVFAAIGFAARTQPTSTTAQIDQSFVCPESLPDDAARFAALRAFFGAFAKAAPEETPGDLLIYRRALLEKHGCRKTLAQLARLDAAVRNGEVQRQAWLPLEGPPELDLLVSTDHLKVVIDPRFPSERVVDAYVKLVFHAPRDTNVTHVRFDQLVSHNLYYCNTRRYALIENDYFLGDKEVLKDPSGHAQIGATTVYPVTPTPDGSLNAIAESWACDTAKGAAA